MPAPELALAGLLVIVLIAYVLLGGADFGGGVWDLLATGPRKQEQRALIEHGIGPVWEANHVWLIFAAVLLFSAFPRAFAAITIALHVPLTLFLFGVVLRGSAFVFRSHDPSPGARRRWGGFFSVASLIAPVLLGMAVGTIASGRIRVQDGAVVTGFFRPWLGLFPLAIGLLALGVCALLAAVYLAREAAPGPLREDFRRRALITAVAVGAVAFAALGLAEEHAPRVHETLTARPWAWLFHVLTGAAAVTVLFALWKRRFGLARVGAAAQAMFILVGWTLAQYPYLLVPDLTLHDAAANPRALKAVLIAALAGLPILLPSLYLLFRIFKAPKVMPPPSDAPARPA